MAKLAPMGDVAKHKLGYRGLGGSDSLVGTAGDASVAVLPIPEALVPRAGWWELWHHAAPGLPLLLSPLEH